MAQLSTAVALAVLTLACIWAGNLRHVLDSSIFCEMTYMYPGYNEVQAQELDAYAYTLKEYVEGWPTQQGPDKDATPALFIPGNAASYAQVRSLAAESWRIYSRSREPLSPRQYRPLQWFAVDTGEQYTAFDGLLLESQVNFTVAALQYLTRRYKSGSSHGAPIMVMGHSMGGIVARAAVQRLHSDGNLQGDFPVCLLLTLSSPHQRGPLVLHPHQAQVYSSLQSSPWAPVPVISISAGDTDMQVSDQLTSLTGTAPSGLRFEANMQHVRTVWTGADHQMVVWCHQLVSRLAHMLLETVLEMDNAESAEERTGVILSLAQQRLNANVSAALSITPVSGAKQGAEAARGQGGERERDSGGAESQVPACPVRVRQAGECMGPNLAWHQQYLKPKRVKNKLWAVDGGKVKASKLGKLWSWNLTKMVPPNTHSSVFVLVSGIRQCDDWKLWLVWDEPVCSPSNITDVTMLAAPAPPVYQSARPQVRDRSTSDAVFSGRDYSGDGTWLLRLSGEELKGVAEMVMWVDTKQLPAGFHVTVQVHSDIVAPPKLPMWVLGVGVSIPEGAPAVSGLDIGASQLLVRMLELGLSVTSSDAPADNQTCWMPVLVDAGATHTEKAEPVVALGGLHPFSSHADISRLYLVTDPRCRHFVFLQSTILVNAVPLLLTHAATIIGLMFALSTAGLPSLTCSSSVADSATRAIRSTYVKTTLVACMLLSLFIITIFHLDPQVLPLVPLIASTQQRLSAVEQLVGLKWALFPSPALQLLLFGVAVSLLKVLGIVLGVLVAVLSWPVGVVHVMVGRAQVENGARGRRKNGGSMVALSVGTVAILLSRLQYLNLPPAAVVAAAWLLLLLAAAWHRCTRWRTVTSDSEAVHPTPRAFNSWLLWHTCALFFWAPSLAAWFQANILAEHAYVSHTSGSTIGDWAAVLLPALLAVFHACFPPGDEACVEAADTTVFAGEDEQQEGFRQAVGDRCDGPSGSGDRSAALNTTEQQLKSGQKDKRNDGRDRGSDGLESLDTVQQQLKDKRSGGRGSDGGRSAVRGSSAASVAEPRCGSGVPESSWACRMVEVVRGAVSCAFIVSCFGGCVYTGVFVQSVLALAEFIGAGVAAAGDR